MSQSGVTTSDGLRLAVTEHGDPALPTVVAVHGYPDDHTVWDDVVTALAVDHHVVTYDVRGAGASDAPRHRSGYDLDQLTDDLLAVIDAVSPGRPVHLLGHDWGAIQTWNSVTDERLTGRVASFTSISGPCLDHVGSWFRRRPTPKNLREIARQARSSWYIAAFRLPVLPELAWRSGLFGRAMVRMEGIPTPSPRDGVNGLGLYRRNMATRLAAPRRRRTAVPVQVIAPTGDGYVTTPMQTDIAQHVETLFVRRVPGGHWLPRNRPDVVARAVRELVADVETGTQAPALRRARAGTGRWTDRVVVVTGAGSGIGRETVLAFARRGAEVVAADRDATTAKETAELASALGARATSYQVDVSDGAAMAEFAEQVAAVHGVPDLVVNNAGIGMAGAFADTTLADWEKIIDVNLWGVIHGCRLFAAQMREHGEGGHIVNIASAAAFTPQRTLSAYATTKSAVYTLSECLRAELAEHNIGVTAVCPGFVHTNITATTKFVGADEATEQRRQSATTALYARRNYTPDRVATQIVRAVERDIAIAPVTPEAHASLLLYRLTPGLVRAVAKREIGPK
ncbi:SDR family oxidoreductase [Pseudonocardia sp. GCM10023141]|uniref:SDR family oxidoreductase n=1 Tax=Pseudonocardia sp. GCM10023141 TaxID=3252653 RepID=UPI0036167E03